MNFDCGCTNINLANVDLLRHYKMGHLFSTEDCDLTAVDVFVIQKKCFLRIGHRLNQEQVKFLPKKDAQSIHASLCVSLLLLPTLLLTHDVGNVEQISRNL